MRKDKGSNELDGYFEGEKWRYVKIQGRMKSSLVFLIFFVFICSGFIFLFGVQDLGSN